MILRMYSIRDELSGFMSPVLEQNDAIAMRNFRMACDSQQAQSLMSFKPSDFTLYHIADFDTNNGCVAQVLPLELVCSGSDFYRKGDSNNGKI